MYENFANFFGGIFVVCFFASLAMPFVIAGFIIIAHIGFDRDINQK